MICGARVAEKESSELKAASKSRRKSCRASPLVRNVMSAASSSSPKAARVSSRRKSSNASESKQPQNGAVAAAEQTSKTSAASCESKSTLETNCPVCGETDRTKLQNCSRCRIVSYCTKEHQKLDFRVHKKLCIEIGKAEDPEQKQQLMKQLFVETVARIPESGQPKGNGAIKKILINKSHIKSNGKDKEINQNQAKIVESSENNTEASQNLVEDRGINLHKREKGDNEPPITYEGSSEDTILESRAELLNPLQDSRVNNNNITTPSTSKMPEVQPKVNGIKHYPEIQLSSENSQFLSDRGSLHEIDNICWNVIHDMNKFGVCVVNNFLGVEKGDAVLKEVLNIHNAGLFKDGQLVSNKAGLNHTRTIRGDKIVWLHGKEKFCKNIGTLISKVDAIIMRANKLHNNGKLGQYTINGRTKAMVACYPGHGSHYVKHVDNPNRDGRCITAIYYLNKHWCSATMGGLLRIFPDGWDQVANIEPFFDRILFFWSDRRNPHEVQPAFQTRYAITLWYFDAEERNEACRRYQRVQTSGYGDAKSKEEKKS